MSRWGKNIVVPLDSLIKEKENTNRPTAARSAGTVGKWGKMGFTSTRTYALKAIPSVMAPVKSPHDGDHTPNVNSVTSSNDPPKPKKFFKTRNAIPDILAQQIIHHLPRAPPSPIRAESTSQHRHYHHNAKEQKVKVAKVPKERKKSLSSERIPKVNAKEKKKDEKKLKPEATPTRRISRTRKVVNYNEEDDDEAAAPKKDKLSVPDEEQKEKKDVQKDEIVELEKEPTAMDPPNHQVVKPPVLPQQPAASLTPKASASATFEHPPIVLRISKGTSRLISTDSEDQPNSPVRDTTFSDIATEAIGSTEELLAVLSAEADESSIANKGAVVDREEPLIQDDLVSDNQSGVVEKTSKAFPEQIEAPSATVEPAVSTITSTTATTTTAVAPPKERIKLVIRTEQLKAKNEKSERKKNKKHHKSASTNLKIVEHQFKTPSPQPAALENLELCRTLVGSPSERDFDSQSSILGSVSSNGPMPVPEESCVIRSRGSSDITSDVETSQHSSLVAPPSDIELRLESMMEGDEDISTLRKISPETLQTTGSAESEVAQPVIDDILGILTGDIESQSISQVVEKAADKVKASAKVTKDVVEEEPIPVPTKRVTRGRKNANLEPVKETVKPSEPEKRSTRVTRNNNNAALKNKKAVELSAPLTAPAPAVPAPVRSYGRKRKNIEAVAEEPAPVAEESTTVESKPLNLTVDIKTAENIDLPDSVSLFEELPSPPVEPPQTVSPVKINIEHKGNATQEYKIKSKLKRTWFERDAKSSEEQATSTTDTNFPASETNSRGALRSSSRNTPVVDINMDLSGEEEPPLDSVDSKRSFKLVISKKKGSIFKSRALVAEKGDNSKKRHIYKHTWDADDEAAASGANPKLAKPSAQSPSAFEDDDFGDGIESTSGATPKMTRLTKQNPNKFEDEPVSSVKIDRKAKEFYTVVRNVKTAHQIQEIGEYQEMDDDVEYILDALQPHNPIPTRCLSAIQLASKCMAPGFRMHVRAHGTVTKFFKVLKDAHKDLSLGLCAATIMFVLSQDTLNMDLDHDSLELMMNLLESDAHKPSDDTAMANFERNKQKVREICEEIKSQGKGAHLNIEAISVGTLAMETLLSLTSKRAGEWFKEALRELGGLEHIIKTICDCCHQITDYVVNWTDVLLDKLRTIERCLRVLENVSTQNERNQNYILSYSNGNAVDTLVKLYKLCDSEIALYPTTDATPKENPGVVLREALLPTLKVLINLTHPFNDQALGSVILGEKQGIFDTSFHILLQAPNYIPERCIFDLSILVLLLLINLTMHTIHNRTLIMQSHAPSDFGNQFVKVPAIKALIAYFYKCEEQARLAEKNTDAILENPNAVNNKLQSQEEIDETVTKLLQKAGHHMEHTLQATYAGILIGHLISGSDENEKTIRGYLKDNSFMDIVHILEKYYNFIYLTASSEASVVSHIKSTKNLIEYFKKCDTHSSNSSDNEEPTQQQQQSQPEKQQMKVTSSTSGGLEDQPAASSSSMKATRSATHRVYKTYSQR